MTWRWREATPTRLQNILRTVTRSFSMNFKQRSSVELSNYINFSRFKVWRQSSAYITWLIWKLYMTEGRPERNERMWNSCVNVRFLSRWTTCSAFNTKQITAWSIWKKCVCPNQLAGSDYSEMRPVVISRDLHNHQAPVVWRLDNAVHWIKLYPVDNAICLAITYLPDSVLSVG